jgi:hypothetical protein
VNIRIGRISQLLTPDYSWCHRCGTTWYFVRWHCTTYEPGRGCFPLCEKCWRGLKTPEARVPYYRQLWDEWAATGTGKAPETWGEIERAVLNGG